jgi:outer membrane protein assembly factor BamA
MRRAFVTVMLLLIACPARADEPAPPPDPARGERYDGRSRPPASWKDDLLAIPRIILAPVRLVFKAIGVPVHHVLDWDEAKHVHEEVLAALTTKDGKLGIRPAFQYSISFTPIVGVRVFDQKLLGPGTTFDVTAMSGGINVIYAEAAARPTPADRAVEVTIDAIYNRRNDQVFTGIGYATDDKVKVTPGSRYAIDALDAGGKLTWAAAPGLFLDLSTMFGLRRFGNGRNIADELPIAQVYCVRGLSGLCDLDSVDEVRVPGFNRGTQFFRGGVNVRIDSRDNWYRPSSGALIEVGADWSHGIGFDQSHYVRAHAAVSGVLDLWQRSRVLIVRIEANDLEPIGDAAVPFSELIVLGGPDTFRGFRPGRFRNFSSLFAGIEYRWPIWMWMDASLFSEYGGVFGQHFEGASLDRMKPDVGAGVRLRSSDSFFARAQVAYGWGDRWQFFFSVNTGF